MTARIGGPFRNEATFVARGGSNYGYSSGPAVRVSQHGKFTSRQSFLEVLHGSVESWKSFADAAKHGRASPRYLSPTRLNSKKLRSDQNLSNGRTNRDLVTSREEKVFCRGGRSRAGEKRETNNVVGGGGGGGGGSGDR